MVDKLDRLFLIIDRLDDDGTWFTAGFSAENGGPEYTEYLLATPERKAAGELLAACEELVEEIEYGDRLVYDDQRAVLARVKAAIAAATPDTD